MDGNIYIEVGKNGLVTKVHRFPFDPSLGLQTPREELEQTGVFVDKVPEPRHIPGKQAIMKYDYDQREIYYEYIVAPLTDKERLDLLEQAMNEMLMSNIKA